jgi:acetyltransferase-like isoleucine patch superfamily enzyme
MRKVSKKARIGRNVRVGEFSIVHEDVIIGDDTTIDPYCVIGYPNAASKGRPLVIGDGAVIRSHSVIYSGSTIGPNLRTGHHVTIRENVVAGRDLQLGSYGDIQNDVTIGEYVKTHSSVQINRHTRIGNFVWLFPYVVIANDPHPPSDTLEGVCIEDFVAVGAQSCILPGVVLHAGCVVAAGALVSKSVRAGMLVAGVPARPLGNASTVSLRDGSGRSAYPWRFHFHRGYPPALVALWTDEATKSPGTKRSANRRRRDER